MARPSEKIRAAVSEWPETSEAPHRFGGVEFKLGSREVGHIHGDRLVDIPFPRAVRDELVSAGQAEPHHVLPDSGWVSFRIRNEADVEHAIGLLRRSYDVISAQLARRKAQSEAVRAR